MKILASLLLSLSSILVAENTLQNSAVLRASSNPNDSYTTEKDRLILINLRQQISSQFGKKYDAISIRVSNGAVTFVGTVDNHLDVQTMTNKGHSVQGVTTIANRLIVANKGQIADSGNALNSYTTDKDRVLALNVRGAIKKAFGSAYESLKISVQNGIVRLTGLVKSQQDVDKLLTLAGSLDGVAGVDNRLTLPVPPPPRYEDSQTVDPRDSYSTAVDRQIVITLRAALENISADNYDKVYINVVHGLVTLSGNVPSKRDAKLAVDKAIQTQGVRTVNDTLRYAAS